MYVPLHFISIDTNLWTIRNVASSYFLGACEGAISIYAGRASHRNTVLLA